MSIDEAVEWMLARFDSNRCLYQEDVATHFLHLKDMSLTYYDSNSNICITKEVLAKFNAATPDAVYERAGKFWRARVGSDKPGRQQ